MKVGYKLYREVLDRAYLSDWDTGMRVVAWVIADDARDSTRISLIKPVELCRKTGLKPSGVQAALQRLAEAGYEFRVPLATGRNGRPVYSRIGREVQYRVPSMAVDEPLPLVDKPP